MAQRSHFLAYSVILTLQRPFSIFVNESRRPQWYISFSPISSDQWGILHITILTNFVAEAREADDVVTVD
jgi:hypothetical protein